MSLIYLIGRDRDVFTSVRRCLEDAGYPVCWFMRLSLMLTSASRYRPSLVIVDSGDKDAPVSVLCSRIRSVHALTRVPLLILGERLTEKTRVSALDAGADGFVSHPFSAREMLWKLAALQPIGRTAPPSADSASSVVTIGDLRVNRTSMRVTLKERVIETTALEFRVLELLARHPGRVFSRDELLHTLWQKSHASSPRSVDACMRRIRNRLEPSQLTPTYIKSIRGIGYKLDMGPRKTLSESADNGES